MDKLNSGNGSPNELNLWSKRIGIVMTEIESKSDRWLELSEIVEG